MKEGWGDASIAKCIRENCDGRVIPFNEHRDFSCVLSPREPVVAGYCEKCGLVQLYVLDKYVYPSRKEIKDVLASIFRYYRIPFSNGLNCLSKELVGLMWDEILRRLEEKNMFKPFFVVENTIMYHIR